MHINAECSFLCAQHTLVDCAVGKCPAATEGYLPCWSGPRAGCWVQGLRRPRSYTRQVESVRGEPGEKQCGASCCCLTTQTAHKTRVCQSSRRSHVSPGPRHYPPPRLPPGLESTHTKRKSITVSQITCLTATSLKQTYDTLYTRHVFQTIIHIKMTVFRRANQEKKNVFIDMSIRD